MEYTSDPSLLLYGFVGAQYDWPMNLIVAVTLGALMGLFYLGVIKHHE